MSLPPARKYIVCDIENPEIGLYCPDCGSLVIDTKRHDNWHSKEGF